MDRHHKLTNHVDINANMTSTMLPRSRWIQPLEFLKIINPCVMCWYGIFVSVILINKKKCTQEIGNKIHANWHMIYVVKPWQCVKVTSIGKGIQMCYWSRPTMTLQYNKHLWLRHFNRKPSLQKCLIVIQLLKVKFAFT